MANQPHTPRLFIPVLALLSLLILGGSWPNRASAAPMVEGTQSSVDSLPFNGWLAFPSASDYAMTVADNSELDLPDASGDDFTVEGYFLLRSLSNNYSGYIINKSPGYGFSISQSCPSLFTCYRYLSMDVSAGTLTTSWKTPFTNTFSTSNWYHMALVNDATAQVVRIYLNGYLYAAYDENFPYYHDSPGGYVALGYLASTFQMAPMQKMDEVRISNTIRYTSNFAPSTTPFTCDQYTRALWHFDEIEGKTQFHDSCGNEDNILYGFNNSHTEGVIGHFIYLPMTIK
jgi:hypothetical protein